MDMKTWLEQATGKIEFSHDRAAVRRELEDHLQDRRERYAAKGLTPEEAERAALTDMGDPADIAEELGRLHRPWWGYLWRLSQGLVALLLILTAITLSDALELNNSKLGPPEEITDPASVFGSEPVPVTMELSGKVRRGWYTFSAYALLHELTGPEHLLHIYLRSDPVLFWEPNVPDSNVMQRITVTDSEGGRHTIQERGFRTVHAWRTGSTAWMEFVIELEEAQFPNWVEVSLNQDQPAFRLDLQEGVLCE